MTFPHVGRISHLAEVGKTVTDPAMLYELGQVLLTASDVWTDAQNGGLLLVSATKAYAAFEAAGDFQNNVSRRYKGQALHYQGNANLQLGKHDDAMESFITSVKVKREYQTALEAEQKAAATATAAAAGGSCAEGGGATGVGSDLEKRQHFELEGNDEHENLLVSIATTIHQIGNVHGFKARTASKLPLRKRLVKKAIGCYTESLEIKKALPDQGSPEKLRMMLTTLNSLAQCNQALGNADVAMNFFNEQLAALRVVHADTPGHASIRECLTQVINLKKAMRN